MDFKKLWIEGAVYPAMTLLQHNQVAANTRALQSMETLPAEERAVRTRQRLSELLFLCKTQVPAYSDLPFTDLDIRREPLDCLQAVDPMPLSDFLDEAENHLSRLAQAEKLLRCPVQRGEREISFAMTHERNRVLRGSTVARPRLVRRYLWQPQRPSLGQAPAALPAGGRALSQKPPFLVRLRHDCTERPPHPGGDRPLPPGVPLRQRHGAQ